MFLSKKNLFIEIMQTKSLQKVRKEEKTIEIEGNEQIKIDKVKQRRKGKSFKM